MITVTPGHRAARHRGQSGRDGAKGAPIVVVKQRQRLTAGPIANEQQIEIAIAVLVTQRAGRGIHHGDIAVTVREVDRTIALRAADRELPLVGRDRITSDTFQAATHRHPHHIAPQIRSAWGESKPPRRRIIGDHPVIETTLHPVHLEGLRGDGAHGQGKGQVDDHPSLRRHVATLRQWADDLHGQELAHTRIDRRPIIGEIIIIAMRNAGRHGKDARQRRGSHHERGAYTAVGQKIGHGDGQLPPRHQTVTQRSNGTVHSRAGDGQCAGDDGEIGWLWP